ncbi:MAG: hypothetical protein EOO02_07935 [Chitinophagaceae bacterium]|nr:MAG: hypothetical protein EOO02_07935 [Chitinophagaceae bacterium]
MVFTYLVTLRNENVKYIDAISLLICTASALMFLREHLITSQNTIKYIVGFIFVAFLVGRNIWLQFFRKAETVKYNRALFFAALVWTIMPYFQWLVFPLALLGFFEFHAKFPLEIGFTDKVIVFNSLFKKKYTWQDFNNIVLKDNMLTLDFKSNKLFQKETIDEDGEADEDEFNDFCRQYLPS